VPWIPDPVRVTVRALGAAVAAVAAIVRVPGPLVIVDVVVVEPVLAADAVNGVATIIATAEPVLAATTTDSSVTPAPVPEPDETAIPFDIIAVEVPSATVPAETVTVHVTAAAVAATVVLTVVELMLYAVNVTTYVPGTSGVNATLYVELDEW